MCLASARRARGASGLWCGRRRLGSGIGVPLSTEVVVALIAALASVVISVASAVLAYLSRVRSETHIAEVQHTLDELTSERNARRDYEYEARKRLYVELQPVFFQMVERSDRALDRIRVVAENSARGKIFEPSRLGQGWERDPYHMTSTVWDLLAPLAYFRLAQQKLTALDLSVDPQLRWQYLLARELYESWTAGNELAAQLPPLPYDDEERETRQHVLSGHLEDAVDCLLRTRPGGGENVISYADFSRSFLANREKEIYSLFTGPLTDAHPERKPVLWRVLLTQAHLHAALIKTFNSVNYGDPTLVHPLDALPPQEWDDFDWRFDERTSRDTAVIVPFTASRNYLKSLLVLRPTAEEWTPRWVRGSE